MLAIEKKTVSIKKERGRSPPPPHLDRVDAHEERLRVWSSADHVVTVLPVSLVGVFLRHSRQDVAVTVSPLATCELAEEPWLSVDEADC